MASAETLMAVIGARLDSERVRVLIASDSLIASSEPDLDEGEPIRSHLSNPMAGYELGCQEGRVDVAFLYVTPAECYSAFTELLPGDLTALNTRDDVLGRFGVPEMSREAFTHRVLGRQGAWDRFLVGPLRVHFAYTEADKRISRVTLMLADKRP